MQRHFSNWGSRRPDRALQREIGRILNDTGVSSNGFPECFDWQERQAKFIMHSLRVYEFFGYGWRTPWWDNDLTAFWQDMDVSAKLNRSFFFYGEKHGWLDAKLKGIPFENELCPPRASKPLSRRIIEAVPPSVLSRLLRATGYTRKFRINEGLHDLYGDIPIERLLAPFSVLPGYLAPAHRPLPETTGLAIRLSPGDVGLCDPAVVFRIGRPVILVPGRTKFRNFPCFFHFGKHLVFRSERGTACGRESRVRSGLSRYTSKKRNDYEKSCDYRCEWIRRFGHFERSAGKGIPGDGDRAPSRENDRPPTRTRSRLRRRFRPAVPCRSGFRQRCRDQRVQSGWRNPDIYRETLRVYPLIIRSVKEAGVRRLLIVGGAGSLYVAPGVRVMDRGGSGSVRSGRQGTGRGLLFVPDPGKGAGLGLFQSGRQPRSGRTHPKIQAGQGRPDP